MPRRGEPHPLVDRTALPLEGRDPVALRAAFGDELLFSLFQQPVRRDQPEQALEKRRMAGSWSARRKPNSSSPATV